MTSFLWAQLIAGTRNGLRQLRTARLYSVVVVLTLGLGLSAAVAILAVTRAVLLKPLPYANPGQLVMVQSFQPATRRDQSTMSVADMSDYRSGSRTLADLASYHYSEVVLSDGGLAQRELAAEIDANVFAVLGTQAFQGRFFLHGEDGETPAHAVVLSYSLWQSRYGGNPALIGHSVTIDGESYQVVGITPPRFEFPRSAMMDQDVLLWLPAARSRLLSVQRGRRNLTVVARIRPEFTLAQTEQELRGVAARLASSYPPSDDGWSVRIVPLHEAMTGRVAPTLALLTLCVLLLLVAVTANVAAAILARSSGRAHALAVRVALGAGVTDVVWLLLSETVTLALIAALIALPLGSLLVHVMVRAAPVSLPRLGGLHIDLLTAAATGMLALVAGVLAAAGPAWHLARVNLSSMLTESNRGSAGSRRLRNTLSLLVLCQVGLATVLATGTLTIARGYHRLSAADPGFEGHDVLTGSIALPGTRYASVDARAALTEGLIDRLRAQAGVTHAAVASLLPLSGGMMSSSYRAAGGDVGDTLATAALRSVSDDFFATLSIPLQAGRSFTPADDRAHPLVIVVNRAFVRQALAGRDAVGQLVRVAAPGSDSATAFRVIGVAGDARERDLLSDPSPIIYFSNRQVSFPHVVVMARSSGALTARTVRSVLATIDPSLAVDDVAMLQDKVQRTYALRTFLLKVMSLFASCALCLVVIGVYALVSFAAAADERAHGIRAALGASGQRIRTSIIGRSLALGGLGCAAGELLLLAGHSLIAAAVPGESISLADGAASGVMLMVVAGVSASIPAWRAGRVDPALVLRS